MQNHLHICFTFFYSAKTQDGNDQAIQDIHQHEFIKRRFKGFEGTSVIVRWLVSFFTLLKQVFMKNLRYYIFINSV